jgi:O-antigen ligase
MAVVLLHPLGLGLGSGGNGTRLDPTASAGAVGDNGYLELLSTLGLVQTLLFVGGLFVTIRPGLVLPGRGTSGDPYATLGTAMVFTLIPTMMVADSLAGAHASYMWLLLANAIAFQLVPTNSNQSYLRSRRSMPIMLKGRVLPANARHAHMDP